MRDIRKLFAKEKKPEVDAPQSRAEGPSDAPGGSGSPASAAPPVVTTVAHSTPKIVERRAALPWEKDLMGFKFAQLETLCVLEDIGIQGNFITSFCKNALVFTMTSKVLVYNYVRRSLREIKYESFDSVTEHDVGLIRFFVTPDGTKLVRWRRESEGDGWSVDALDLSTFKVVGAIEEKFGSHQVDMQNTQWTGASTVYISDGSKGTVTRWSCVGSHVDVIRPLSSVTSLIYFSFYPTEDGSQWVAVGSSYKSNDRKGVVQIHDVRSDESMILPGNVCCMADVDVYDNKKTLLAIADVDGAGKLSISVHQLDLTLPGEPFQSVTTAVDFLKAGDHPIDVHILDHLPVVLVTTVEKFAYFFELHTGTYMFSADLGTMGVVTTFSSPAERQCLIGLSFEKRGYVKVTVNKDDLIGYVRQVLKDDTLASAIAIRTGLKGAEDVIFDDMHAQYNSVGRI